MIKLLYYPNENKLTLFRKKWWNEYIPGDDTRIRVFLPVCKDTIYNSEYLSVNILIS